MVRCYQKKTFYQVNKKCLSKWHNLVELHIRIWHNFSPCYFNNAQIFCKIVQFWIKSIEPGGRGGALAHPIFYRSVNPFPTRVTDSAHPFLLATPIFFTFGIIHKWCPIFLSHFWPPSPLNLIFTFYNPIFWGHFRPPLKSDIIYVCSLNVSYISIDCHKSVKSFLAEHSLILCF